jgi:hypothetical protein
MIVTKNDKPFKTDIDFNSEEAITSLLSELANKDNEFKPILVCPVGVVDLPKKIVEDKGINVTVMTFEEFNELNPNVDLTMTVSEPNYEDLRQKFEETLYHSVPTVEQIYTENIIQQVRRKETVRRKENEKWARRNWKHR